MSESIYLGGAVLVYAGLALHARLNNDNRGALLAIPTALCWPMVLLGAMSYGIAVLIKKADRLTPEDFK